MTKVRHLCTIIFAGVICPGLDKQSVAIELRSSDTQSCASSTELIILLLTFLAFEVCSLSSCVSGNSRWRFDPGPTLESYLICINWFLWSRLCPQDQHTKQTSVHGSHHPTRKRAGNQPPLLHRPPSPHPMEGAPLGWDQHSGMT